MVEPESLAALVRRVRTKMFCGWSSCLESTGYTHAAECPLPRLLEAAELRIAIEATDDDSKLVMYDEILALRTLAWEGWEKAMERTDLLTGQIEQLTTALHRIAFSCNHEPCWCNHSLGYPHATLGHDADCQHIRGILAHSDTAPALADKVQAWRALEAEVRATDLTQCGHYRGVRDALAWLDKVRL